MITFDNVHKTFPGGVVAVGGVSLEVPTGSTTVLLGTSGSGKTTLMRMVNRMVTPTSGRVLVNNQDVATMDPVRLRRSIGYVLQDGGLFPHQRVIDNITTVPVLDGTPRAQARERAMELLELVGLPADCASRFPAQLSGGQRQRVGVARALANKPDLLLMDEPFGALDPLVRSGLQQELRDLQHRLGTTILFVTHDVDEAFLLGDEVVILRTGGMVAQVGAPAELLASPADDFVADFVGASAARRRLRTINEGGATLIIDEDGRPLGCLDEASVAHNTPAAQNTPTAHDAPTSQNAPASQDVPLPQANPSAGTPQEHRGRP
ncbi:MAG: ATP-binding cassette domain-containing protein [Actinomycetaceae bacterium]|nr:ATP-binding cassette domain-containing protein [Actinomycetaceae bacterium]